VVISHSGAKTLGFEGLLPGETAFTSRFVGTAKENTPFVARGAAVLSGSIRG